MLITDLELDTFLKRDFHQNFDEEILQFCERISKAFLKQRQNPDLVALGFWLRNKKNHKRVGYPRGLVFHIPPSNVDTMFVYSWILSLLAGNGNIVRLPTRRTPSVEIAIEIIQENLGQLAETNGFISYGHEEEITRKISSKADVRVIWGGDQTVKKIRKIPLKPSAKEIVFPDRYSYAVIRTAEYLSLREEEKIDLSKKFFNDTYWFDQLGCSSPRIVFFVGKEEVSGEFFQQLQRTIDREIPLGNYLEKLTFIHTKIPTLPIKTVKTYSNELTVMELKTLDQGLRDHCGQGLFYQYQIEELNELIPFVDQKDQTLVYYGFSKEELHDFQKEVNGRGIDRIVPIGQALNFEEIWDGYHILQELTRCQVVR